MRLLGLASVVSRVAAGDVPALEDVARTAGVTVLHVDADAATDKPSLLAAIATSLDLDDGRELWNWSAITDLIWQEVERRGSTVLVVDRVDRLRPDELDLAASAFEHLAASVSPTPLVTVLSGTGRSFPPYRPG